MQRGASIHIEFKFIGLRVYVENIDNVARLLSLQWVLLDRILHDMNISGYGRSATAIKTSASTYVLILLRSSLCWTFPRILECSTPFKLHNGSNFRRSSKIPRRGIFSMVRSRLQWRNWHCGIDKWTISASDSLFSCAESTLCWRPSRS